MILYGPYSSSIGHELAEALGQKKVGFVTKIFPDGESYIRLPESVGEQTVVVNTLFPDQDKRFVETLLMCDSLTRNGADEITLVTPYLAYARQDKVFLNGEPIALKALGSALSCVGVKKLVAVEAHSQEAIEALGLEAINVKVNQSLCGAVQALPQRPHVVVAPDEKASFRAKEIADKLGLELMVFSKYRDRDTGEVKKIEPLKPVDVKEKVVVLVDDIISSGESIAKASVILKSLGAGAIYAVCVHALMVKNAEQRLRDSGVLSVFGSNTVENEFAKFSVAKELTSALKLDRDQLSQSVI